MRSTGSPRHPRTTRSRDIGQVQEFTTTRLVLEAASARHLEAFCGLHADPLVMRYIGDGATQARAEVVAFIARATRYPRIFPGLGIWSARTREDGRFIGWFCLK